jgi:outer membrane protein OmpA-like peptidoglycan-associated protein
MMPVNLPRIPTTLAVVLISLLPVLSACSGGAGSTEAPPAAVSSADLAPEALDACRQVFERTVPEAAERVVVVLDATASVADMPLPAGLADDLRRLSLADGSLSIIAVDGADVAPRILAKHVAVSTAGERDRPSVGQLAEVIPTCVEAVYRAQATPTSPGTDLHRALALAAEMVGPGTTLWVVSDMLGSAGPLALDAGLIARLPEDAARMAAQAAPVDLAGATLRVSGIGNASTPMLSGHRTWLRDFTAGLCRAWGASGCDSFELDPVNPARTATDLPADPVPVLPGVSSTSTPAGCSFELSAALFAGDSAVLGPDAATSLAGPLALLREHPSATAAVVGHTASSPAYTAEQLVDLGRRRAAAVQAHLLAGGIHGSRIVVRGVGDSEPQVEDIDPGTGRQIEAMARLERRVEVLVGGVPCSR